MGAYRNSAKSGDGLCYGYDVVKVVDAAGTTPRTIARRLNDEGLPGPSDRLWADSTGRVNTQVLGLTPRF